MYLLRGYLTVSWWPHLGMHAANGLDLGGQLVIEYLFHLPLEVAGVVLAYSFFSLFRS
jgi:ABC-type Fe3+ transport system permease subunit